MRGGTLLTLGPFGLVAVLALSIAVAGFIAGPPVRLASPLVEPLAGAVAPSPSRSPRTLPSATAAPARASDPVEMLRVHNELRTAVGAPAVRADERAAAAAQRHAEYLARSGAIGHDETSGQPGFTGATVRDRLAAQGYADAAASEVAASSGSPVEDVRFLWDLPYHRLGLMHPHAVVAGWGHAEIGGHTATVGVIVFDFTAAAPARVRSPAVDQRVATSWSGGETPDVLPTGASRPVGYPVMVVYANARAVDLRSARLTDAAGGDLSVYVVPQIYERDYVAIVPAVPLARGVRYRVRLELSVAGADLVEEWGFETEP
jgi:uncharacterized protein YkwD